MDDGAAVEVSEADADLVRDVGDLRLGQTLLQVHQDRVQRAAVAELQEHLQGKNYVMDSRQQCLGGLFKQWKKGQVWPFYGSCTADSRDSAVQQRLACSFSQIAWAYYNGSMAGNLKSEKKGGFIFKIGK